MAKKKTSVLKRFLESTSKDLVTARYQFGDDEVFNYHIKPFLTVEERTGLIKDVVDTLFSAEPYNQAYYWPVVRTFMLVYLTDIDIKKASSKSWNAMDVAMSLWCETDISDQIESVLGSINYWQLVTDIKKAVEDEKEARKPVNKILSGLAALADKGAQLSEDDVNNMKSIFSKLANVKQSDFVESVIAQKDKLATEEDK